MIKCQYEGCNEEALFPGQHSTQLCRKHTARFYSAMSQGAKAMLQFWIDMYSGPEATAERVLEKEERDAK